MKAAYSLNRNSALTLVEVLVILAALGVLFFLLMPRMGANPKTRGKRIRCVYNLHAIGRAELNWANDHGGKFPFDLSQTNGGTMEFSTGANVWRHLQITSNALDLADYPFLSSYAGEMQKALICPADSDRMRKASTNFTALSNSNLSYFIGLESTPANPQGILSGDRNLTNGTPIRNGILELTSNHHAGWTAEMHDHVGNLLLSDGSVQQVSQTGLRQALVNSNPFTNRLQMPILNP